MQRSYEHAHKLFVNNLSRQLIRTPSSLDNFNPDTEANCRVAACEFISDLSNCLQLPKWVTCTAQMSLHQYYDVESVKTSDRMIISISALFVACKVHDRARSADTFVKAAWDVLCTAALKTDMEKNKELARLNDPELVSSLVSSVLAGERAIFYALNFDLQPYKVHDLVMELSDGGLDKNFCTSPQGRNLFKTAWETVVFGAYSHLTQQFSQLEIAWGHVVLAARLLGYSQHLFRGDGLGHWVSQGLTFTNGELELLVNMISAPFIAAADYQPPAAAPPPAQPYGRPAYPPPAAPPVHSPPHRVPAMSPSHRPPSALRHAASPPRAARHATQHSPPHPAAMHATAAPPAHAREHRPHSHAAGGAPGSTSGAAAPLAAGRPGNTAMWPSGVAAAAVRAAGGAAAAGHIQGRSHDAHASTAPKAGAAQLRAAQAAPGHGVHAQHRSADRNVASARSHTLAAPGGGGPTADAAAAVDAGAPPSPPAPTVHAFTPPVSDHAIGAPAAADTDTGDLNPA